MAVVIKETPWASGPLGEAEHLISPTATSFLDLVPAAISDLDNSLEEHIEKSETCVGDVGDQDPEQATMSWMDSCGSVIKARCASLTRYRESSKQKPSYTPTSILDAWG